MKLLAVLIVLMMISIPVFAACTNGCDANSQYSCSKTVTKLTKGTSSTLTVTITNKQQNSVTSLSSQLLGSWFSSSSSTTVISSIQGSGGTASADFSITPTSTGGQDVCIALGSTCTADCGSITIESPAELSITSFSVPSSISASSTFTVSTSVQNSGTETAGSTTAVTATLSSSQCTVSSSTKTIGTISGSGSGSASWSVTAPSSGTCSFTLTVTGTPGGTVSSSKSATIPSSSSSSTTSSGSGGGGGSGGAISKAAVATGTKVLTQNGQTIITVPLIKSGSSALMEIDKPEETNVRRIAILTNKDVNNITITVKKISYSDNRIKDKIFQYIQIDKENITDSDVSSVTIQFDVLNLWLTQNKIDKSTVALNRLYNGEWSQLSTSIINEGSEKITYSSESPGLSILAITGKEIQNFETTKPLEKEINQPIIDLPIPESAKPYSNLIIVIFIIIALIAGYLYYHGQHAKKIYYKFKK